MRKGRIVGSEQIRGAMGNGMVHNIAAPLRIGGRGFVTDVLKEGLRQTAFKTGAYAADAGLLASAATGAIKVCCKRFMQSTS